MTWRWHVAYLMVVAIACVVAVVANVWFVRYVTR